jgi:signal transduction histidine kinase
MGRRLLQEAPGFGEDETFTRMRGVLESGRPEVVEVAVASGDGPIGRVRGVFLHRAIPFGASGVLNLVTDVTEQRRMEDELRNYAKVAAHDLREPIMAAGYFIQLLDRRLSNGRNAENEELLERVRETHARARSLVDGILEYARSGTGLAADAVDTADLVADVAASLTNAVEELHGRLEIAELPVVRGDRAQLGRVFQNLVANGVSQTKRRARVGDDAFAGVVPSRKGEARVGDAPGAIRARDRSVVQPRAPRPVPLPAGPAGVRRGRARRQSRVG